MAWSRAYFGDDVEAFPSETIKERVLNLESVKDIAGVIDYSLLHPTLTDAMMLEGLEKAKKAQVASVCVKPYFVTRAVEVLEFSGVSVGTVVGFPHGGNRTAVKIMEAHQALQGGAVELDMVVNIGKVLSGDWLYVETDIRAIVNLCKTHLAVSKVILENGYLTDPLKVKLCQLCAKLGADYAKTSTGFGPTGAEDADLRLMRASLPPGVGIKAAGGIKTLDRLLKVVELGASRVGTSSAPAILKEAAGRLKVGG